jgi:hypothetical protein
LAHFNGIETFSVTLVPGRAGASFPGTMVDQNEPLATAERKETQSSVSGVPLFTIGVHRADSSCTEVLVIARVD